MDRMFFHVTRDGQPIRKRRYYFSETFAVIAMSAYAKASGDEAVAEKARFLFGKCIEYSTTPGLLEPKFTSTRPSKGIGYSNDYDEYGTTIKRKHWRSTL